MHSIQSELQHVTSLTSILSELQHNVISLTLMLSELHHNVTNLIAIINFKIVDYLEDNVMLLKSISTLKHKHTYIFDL